MTKSSSLLTKNNNNVDNKMNKLKYQGLATLLSLSLTSCSTWTSNPYEEFSIGTLDDDGPDVEATILVGHPQVITRETLINDRIREVSHIEKLLTTSSNEKLKFKPQILRDISVIKALSSQLGISFNPSLGTAFRREENIASLTGNIEILKLRNRLDQLEKQMLLDPTDDTLKPSNEIPTTPTDTNKPDLSESEVLITQLKDTISAVKALIDTITADNTNQKARNSDVLSSPEEYFSDLDAYRAQLRQRQAEINLDDVHDTLGNTLYRLQLTATVLPGDIKDKYGILDLGIKEGKLEDEEIKNLYNDWLFYLNKRASDEKELIKKAKDSDFLSGKLAWQQIKFHLESKKLVSTCEVTLGNEEKLTRYIAPSTSNECSQDKKTSVQPIVTKNINKYFVEKFLMDEKVSDINEFLSKAEKNINDKSSNEKHAICAFKNGKTEVPAEFIKLLKLSKRNVFTYQAQPTERNQRLSTLASASTTMQTALSLAATIPSTGIGIDVGADATKASVGMAQAIERSPIIIGYTDTDRMNSDKPKTDTDQMNCDNPKTDTDQMNCDNPKTDTDQMNCDNPKTDTDQMNSDNPKLARFGYIFGPKAYLDPKENQLVYKHIPASHSVFVDISVPSWWSSLTLNTKSAWAGNWGSKKWWSTDDHKSSNILNSKISAKDILVRLRPKKHAFNDLTNYLSSQYSASIDVASIDGVFPYVVSLCAPSAVDIIIKGKNLWHNPRVFLLGQEQKKENITILPDMEGIVVKVDLNKLPLLPYGKNKNKGELIVWTTFGKAILNTDDNWITFKDPEKKCETPDFKPYRISPKKYSYVGRALTNNKPINIEMGINIKGKIPKHYRQMKVIAQIVVPNKRKVIIGSDTIPMEHENGSSEFSGNISFPFKGLNPEDENIELKLGLQYNEADYDEAKQNFTDSHVVFYPNKSKANLSIEDKKIKIIRGKIKLLLPKKMKRAYPEFKLDKDAFKLTLLNNEKFKNIEIPVHANWEENEVILTLQNIKDEKNQRAELTKACQAGNLEATLVLTQATSSSSIPEINKAGKITFDKTTCP